MGIALLGAAVVMMISQLERVPGGGTAFGLTGTRLAIGVAGNFVLGALMMLGIGLYAPCMILVSLLGMNPTAAFPIMMGSCAFLMPFSSVRFIRARTYNVQRVDRAGGRRSAGGDHRRQARRVAAALRRQLARGRRRDLHGGEHALDGGGAEEPGGPLPHDA